MSRRTGRGYARVPMGDVEAAPERGTRAETKVECEHCGHEFVVGPPRKRKERCPKCGERTIVPLQRAPVWWIAVFGAAVLAIVVPGLTYRLIGPGAALAAAALSLGAIWLLGRRL